MAPANDLDGIDFRPFFDMVVGIIFVLLILVGALIFFQQAAQEESAATAAQKLAHDWREQEAAFLNWLTGHLHDHGIAAQVDLANTTIVIPLADLARLAPGGLPEIIDAPTNDLGRALAADLGCVAASRSSALECAPFGLLRLNEAVVQVRAGSLAAGAALPPDRFAHLLASLLGAAILKGAPDLLALSNASGGIVMRTTSATMAAGADAAGATIRGDLAMAFDFTPP
jgi:hypothetical protein